MIVLHLSLTFLQDLLSVRGPDEYNILSCRYDVMIKTNRFVLIQCSGGLPIVGLLNMVSVPVVAKLRRHALRMRDFSLSIFLSTKQPLTEHGANPVDPLVIVFLV